MTVLTTPGRPLTAAQQRIADLVAEGLSNPQIARRLFLSPRTVQSHVETIFKKLRVDSRVQLALHIARASETCAIGPAPATQVRIALVDRNDHHTIRSCLAADPASAWPMVRAWLALPSTRAGDTEVTATVVGHPAPLPDGDV